MGLNPGTGKKSARSKRLVDMSIQPEVEVYKPPPESSCELFTYGVPLDDEGVVRYHWVQHVYRGKIVHFKVSIQRRDHVMADWTEVYRIDTSHGTVHEHKFFPDGSQHRDELAPIPTTDPWDFVTGWYDRAMALCEDQWSVHLERWR